jgi:hypothetical protein
MGRQIQLHLLENDVQTLIDHIAEKCDLIVLLRYSDENSLTPIDQAGLVRETMTLWNRQLLPTLTRRTIIRNDCAPWHFVDDNLPTLEFSPSPQITWNDRPALVQGRIYTGNVDDTVGFYRWYESITRWIRARFRKNPASFGYIGAQAWDWFQEGGVLLPMFAPPLNATWISEIAKQESWRAVGRSCSHPSR